MKVQLLPSLILGLIIGCSSEMSSELESEATSENLQSVTHFGPDLEPYCHGKCNVNKNTLEVAPTKEDQCVLLNAFTEVPSGHLYNAEIKFSVDSNYRDVFVEKIFRDRITSFERSEKESFPTIAWYYVNLIFREKTRKGKAHIIEKKSYKKFAVRAKDEDLVHTFKGATMPMRGWYGFEICLEKEKTLSQYADFYIGDRIKAMGFPPPGYFAINENGKKIGVSPSMPTWSLFFFRIYHLTLTFEK